jgi:hypothetical protein
MKFNYSTSFASAVKVPLETNKYLSVASIDHLKKILPAYTEDPDLFPFAANACVVNLANYNDDLIDTDVALHIYKRFTNKFGNLEHDRSVIVSTLVNAALTKYDGEYVIGAGSEILAPEGISGYKPFNIAVAGYVWRLVAPNVVKTLIQANDPEHPTFLKPSLSWEMGFNSFAIQLGSEYREDAEIITDPEKVKELFKYHKSQNGSGQTPDGKRVYRLITFAKNEDGTTDYESVLPLGVGFTFKPAAKVAGVVTPVMGDGEVEEVEAAKSTTMKSCGECGHEQEIDDEEEDMVSCAKCGKESMAKTWKKIVKASEDQEINKNIKKLEENISHLTKTNVTPNNIISMKVLKNLAELKSLNDESIKEYSIANITAIVEAGLHDELQAGLEKVQTDWKTKVDTEAAKVTTAQTEASEAKQKADEVEKKLVEVKAELEKLQKEQLQAKANQDFQERMAHFNEKYELDKEDREILATKLNGADEDAFKNVDKEIAVFFKHKIKAAKTDDKKDEKKDDKTVVQEVLASVKPEDNKVPVTVATKETLHEKYANAFKLGETVEASVTKRK